MELSARRPPAAVNETMMDRGNPVEGERLMADVAAGAALGAERSSSPAVAMPVATQVPPVPAAATAAQPAVLAAQPLPPSASAAAQPLPAAPPAQPLPAPATPLITANRSSVGR